MSGNVQPFFSLNDVEEKIGTADVEEFQGSPICAAFLPSKRSKSSWNTCLKAEEILGPRDTESVPIYAASLLDTSLMEQEGTQNGVKDEKYSCSLFRDLSFPDEQGNSNEISKLRKREPLSGNHLKAQRRR